MARATYLNRIDGVGYMLVQLDAEAWEVHTQGGSPVIVWHGCCQLCEMFTCRHAKALRATLAREDAVKLALAQDPNPPVLIGSEDSGQAACTSTKAVATDLNQTRGASVL